MHELKIILKGKTADKNYDKIVKLADKTMLMGRFETKDEYPTPEGYYMHFMATQEVSELIGNLEEKGLVEFA